MIVAVEEKIGESFDAERGLIGMMAGADGAGAHGETAGFDAGAAESDGIGGGEFCGKLLGWRERQGDFFEVRQRGSDAVVERMRNSRRCMGSLPV